MCVPFKIYTFWHNDRIPRDVKRCIESMKMHNPNFEIIVLGSEDVPDCQFRYKTDMTTKVKSDLVRLHFLSAYGGVWLDAHCICTAPLSKVFDFSKSGLQGFQTFDAAIDSYAFATSCNNVLMKTWYAEFKKALQMGCVSYCKLLDNMFILSKDFKKNLPYLTVYAASIFAQDKHHWVKKKNSRDSDGPFFYVDLAKHPSIKVLLHLRHMPALIKLDSHSRKYLKESMGTRTYESSVAKILK